MEVSYFAIILKLSDSESTSSHFLLNFPYCLSSPAVILFFSKKSYTIKLTSNSRNISGNVLLVYYFFYFS